MHPQAPADPPPGLIVTRFAPSPTGHLHIGGARTALFCWAYAKRTGGRFIIRIEDTDQARSSEASARGILEDLAWLGIDWDEGPELTVRRQGKEARIGGDPRRVGPWFQSQRLDGYNAVAGDMLDRGLAYAAFDTPEQLAAMRRAAESAKQTFRYHPAPDQIPSPELQRRRIAAGEPHVVRFRAPDGPVRVTDRVLGEVRFDAGEVDDFVLRKADGFPTYHFGVVLDDQAMGVTHVLRGQEHLMNTPRHVALQHALGYRVPVFAHMPLIFNDQGAKMSKRERDQAARAAVKKAAITSPPHLPHDHPTHTGAAPALDPDAFAAWIADPKRQLDSDALDRLASAMGLALPEVSVHDFRKAGYLPEVITNFLALLGWNPGTKSDDGKDLERFDMAYLAERFDLDRLGKTNARFDRVKLASFNQATLGGMSSARFADRLRLWASTHRPDMLERLGDRFAFAAAAAQPRCKVLSDAPAVLAFALTDDDALALDPKAVAKNLAAPAGPEPDAPTGADLLPPARQQLAQLEPFAPEAIDAWAAAFVQARSVPLGKLAGALRVAVTGAAVSPGLGHTLACLGRASALRRIDRCIAHAGAHQAP